MMAGPRPPRDNRGRTGLAVAVSAVAFVLAAGTVVLALTVQKPINGSTTPVVESTSVATATEPSIPIDSVDVPALTTRTRLMTAFDGDVAWRTTVGTCPDDDAVVERTSDGGKTWNGFDLGSSGGISSVTSLEGDGTSASVHIVAYSKAGCAVSWVATDDAGASWASFPGRVATAWYVDPANQAAVYSPGAVHTAPCDVVIGISPVSATEAAVMCSDRVVFRTSDGGATWTAAPLIANAIAIGHGPEGYLVVSRPDDVTCIGLAVTTLKAAVGDKSTSTSKCIVTGAISDDVAVSGSSSSVWLWSGSTVVRSKDGGTTWQ